MKNWGYKLVIAVGVCMCLAPAAISTIQHGIKYGWLDALKIFGTVAWFVGGMALMLLGLYLKNKKKMEKLSKEIDKIEP
jgi:hypothetical protein